MVIVEERRMLSAFSELEYCRRSATMKNGREWSIDEPVLALVNQQLLFSRSLVQIGFGVHDRVMRQEATIMRVRIDPWLDARVQVRTRCSRCWVDSLAKRLTSGLLTIDRNGIN